MKRNKMNKEHPQAYKFHTMYANLPIPLRQEIVAVVDDEPMTFNVIRLELKNHTQMGHEALDQMIRIGIL